MTDPTERERLLELIHWHRGYPSDDVAEHMHEANWQELADAILADGFHREGAPRTPAPEPDDLWACAQRLADKANIGATRAEDRISATDVILAVKTNAVLLSMRAPEPPK